MYQINFSFTQKIMIMEKLVKRKHADSKGNAQLKPRKRK